MNSDGSNTRFTPPAQQATPPQQSFVTSADVANILTALTSHLQQQNAAFTQALAEQLQQLRESQSRREVRVEGISMPTFSGQPTEDVDEFIFRAKLFMQGKNVDYNLPANQHRVVAMLAANLRGGAASWYHTRVVIDQKYLTTLADFQAALTHEFVPPDQQYRVRAALKQYRQTGSIEEYVAEFRRLIARVRDMSQLDQIDRFCDGLKPKTRKEVSYRRCSTLSEAIEQAQAYERTHFSGSQATTRSKPLPRSATTVGDDEPTPMEIGSVSSRDITKETCRRLGLCFYCKKKGHSISNCPVRRPVIFRMSIDQL